tara:strand:- start:175 stop:1767 length:1593 start_codon:yes stop_codon:yes gene_type:complete
MLGSFAGTYRAQSTYHFIPPDKKKRTPGLEEFSIYYTSLPPERKDIKLGYWHKNPYQGYGAIATEPIMDMDGVDFQTAVGSVTVSTTVEVLTMTGVDFASEVGSIDLATVVKSECRVGHELTPFFLEQQALTNPRSIVKQFTFNGSIMTDRVVKFPPIKRNYTDVVGKPFTMTVENASQLFNELIQNRTKFRLDGEINFGYQFNPSHIDFACIGKGALTNADYSDSQVTIQFKNQLDILAQKKVSTDTTSNLGAPFVGSNYNPADITFEILTANSYGSKLDSTTSQANTDIDYQSWLDWKNTLGSESIVVQAFFPHGANYVQALQAIAETTDAAIYVEANNKLFFRRNLVGVQSFSAVVSDSDIISFDAKADAYDMCNQFSVPVSFAVQSNQVVGPASTVVRQNASSISSFGVLEKRTTTNMMWYIDAAGASNLGDRIVFRRKEPEVALSIKTPIKYLQQQLGDLFFVNIDEVGISDQPYTLIGETIDIENNTQTLELSIGHGIAISNVTVFELDDPDLGTLNNTRSVIA